MVIVICIMAVLMMLSMALMLASSVMVSNAQKTKANAQAKILALSLADELEKELTITKTQRRQLSDEELQASIWGQVRDGIVSGAWPCYEEGAAAQDSAVRTYRLEEGSKTEGVFDKGECVIDMYWERGDDGDYDDAGLTIKVTCTVHKASYTVTSVYTADDGSSDTEEDGEESPPEDTAELYWERSERR